MNEAVAEHNDNGKYLENSLFAIAAGFAVCKTISDVLRSEWKGEKLGFTEGARQRLDHHIEQNSQ